MSGEIDVCGVFVPVLLVSGVLAMLLNLALRAVLTPLGFFRAVWHAALAELAMFVMLFGGIALL